MNPEIENKEGKIFDLVQQFIRNNKVLEQIQVQKNDSINRGERGGEVFNSLSRHVEVSQSLAEEIAALLPGEENISDNEQVIWRGNLSDLQFYFLSGNQFRVDGPNLMVKDNKDEVEQCSDQVAVTTPKDVELAVDPSELTESLYGIAVKIYRA